MLIGVTGDTHNNLKNISKICDLFNQANPSLVIHTGDITLPKSLTAFSKLKMPLVGVFGNNDEFEKKGLIEESKKFNCAFFDEPHKIKIYKREITIIHHPELIDEKMISESDFIFHGHTHRYRLEKIKKCFIFNPGECAGFMKNKNQVGLINFEESEPKVVNF